jgi:hypothetical protein
LVAAGGNDVESEVFVDVNGKKELNIDNTPQTFKGVVISDSAAEWDEVFAVFEFFGSKVKDIATEDLELPSSWPATATST